VFLGHLHRATVDYMSDRQRLENGLPIRRPRRKQQLQNDCRLRKCIAKYDNGEYTQMQFLRAVSHSVMHAQPLQIQDDSSDDNTADNAETEIDNATTSTAGSAESAVSVVASSDPDNCCEVCLLQPREGVALVPCGHARFCSNCADTVAASDRGCPICRMPIRMVLRLYS